MRSHNLTHKMLREDGFILINLLVAASRAFAINAIVIPGTIKASQYYELRVVAKGIGGSLINVRITAGQLQTGHLDQNLNPRRSVLPIISLISVHY